MNRQQQQHRRQLLPLLRRWEAVRATATTSITTTTTTSSSGAAKITVVGAGHINSSRHWFHSQSSVADRSSFFVPRPFLVPREHRHQHQHQQQRWCRYYGTSGNGNDNGDDDDDERRDVQDQKSAFLRALEGNKRRNNHNNSSSSSSNNNTGIRRRNNRNDNQHRNDTSRHHHPSRSRNNNGNSNSNSNSNSDPRTKAFGSGGSKKLTLDEFFANLEQPTQTQTQTPQRTPTRSRGNQHGGQQQRQQQQQRQRQRQRPTPNREARHQYNRNNNNSSRESRPPTRARGSTALPAPAPASVHGMGSFFDDVDALMERKQQQQQQQQTEQQYTETNSRSIGATASASATASVSSSSRRPAAPVFRSSIADMVGPSDPTTTASSALFGGDKQSFEGLGFGVESWDPYTELLEEIMEGPKFLAKLHKKKKKTTTKGKSKVQDDNHDNHDDDNDNDNDNHVENEERTKRQIVQVVEWLRSPRPAVETQLPTLDALLEGDVTNDDVNDSSSTESDRVRSELTAQKERFRTELGWTAGQYDVATGALVAMGGLCAKRCTAQPLDVAWSKLKEMGHPMTSKAVLHNYLYVAATFSFSFSFSLPKQKRRGSSTPGLFGREFEERIGDSTTTTSSTGERGGGCDDDRAPPPPPSVLDFLNQTSAVDTYYSNEEDDGNDGNDGAVIDVAAEVALCHDFFHKATEQSIGIHVRRLVHLGKANEAERLLDASMKSDDLRLRTYAPIYQAYLDDGDVSSAIQLFAKMKKAENVLLLTETYVQLIACIAENGYFRTDANKIDGIEDLEYSKHHGPAMFDALASELAEHSIEITSASAKRLYNAFQRGFEGHNHNDPNDNSNSNNYNLRRLHLLESLRTDNDLARPDELIVSRVKIDASTGLCPRSGSRLRLINLDSAQKQRFRDGLSHLVSSSYQERHHTRKADVADKLNKFGEWLQHRAGGTQKPFTAIIDGPNVAYYMQNFQQGTFNYHQIKFVTDALENMGENVLVVMPKKYTYDSFTIQIGGRSMKQTLSQTERDIRDDLLANGKACVVPVGSLDDYYWMFASVSMEEEFVPPDNPDGRWPGNRPMLVSNDKLRDHKMSLLEPRLFRRWYSNFLVNFTFSAFVNDECVDREIGFRTADFYSREIQGNFDSNGGGGGGTVWHFPVKDWNENESMCIRIPNSENKKD